MTEIALAERNQPTVVRARRTRLVVAVATVVAATTGVLVASSATGGPAGHGPAAFAVETNAAGLASIHTIRHDVAAAEMTRQLHEAGYSVTVKTVSATPQLVGRWLIVSTSQAVPRALSDNIVEQTLDKPVDIELPAHFPGTITLFLGRAMKPGETPTVAGAPNALAPGGLLQCTRLTGATTAVAAARLAASGYTVNWVNFHHRPMTPSPSDRVAAAFIYDFNQHDAAEPIPHPSAVTVVLGDPLDDRFTRASRTGFTPTEIKGSDHVDC